MSAQTFRPKAYVKRGCPFSFKFLVFMAEAGLLDEIEVVHMSEQDPGFEAAKQRLSAGLGKPATFPTVELEPERFVSDSDQLIEHYAQQHHVESGALPVLSFYKETILPKLFELHKIKMDKQ